MTFAHPLMLLGLFGALIPVLVHLFDRRRPRQVPFAALSFVLKSQKRTASRLKLKRLLLYTLRTLLLLAVPLALARPEWLEESAGRTVHGAAATVIIVDTSLAMRWSSGGRSLFEEARAQAKAAVQELTPEEPASILACGYHAAAVAPLSFERARLLSGLADLKPAYQLADLNRCLEQAAAAMNESPLVNRRIVLVSAFTQSALRLELPPPLSTGPQGEKIKPEIVLRDVVGARALDNRAVVDVRAEPAPQVGPLAWQFTWSIRNFSDRAANDVELVLKVDGQAVSKGFVDLAAHGTAQKSMTHQFTKGGSMVVEAQLSPDALPDDDTRAMVLSVPKQLTALIVNGDPSPLKHKDTAFFVEAALSSLGSPVRATTRDADAAWREDFSKYDVVLLLNVTAPTAETGSKLLSFVQNGGGLFISMGDHVEADAYNAVLGGVLPHRLRVVKTAVEPTAQDAATRAARLQTVVGAHPVWGPFTGRAKEGLLSTRFYRYMLFESDAAADVEAIGVMDDGAPVFLTARKGRGRVMAFASTVNREWCDAPIRTAFLPMVQRIAAWLSGTLDEREQLRARVGEVVTVPLESGMVPTAFKDPAGSELSMTRAADGAAVTAGPLLVPGRYAVSMANGQELAFAAALDPAASDTTRNGGDEMAAWFGEDVVKAAGVGANPAKTPLWTWLFVVAAAVFFLEGTLLRR